MNKTVSHQTFWLTGASSGIGLALCELLLATHNTVIATVRNTQALQALQEKYPEQLNCIACDLNDEDSIHQLAQTLNQQHQQLDGLILAAGVCEYIDNANIDMALMKRVFDINFFAACKCCEIALPLLRNSTQKPIILGVSSLSTVAAFNRAEAYGASKAALNYFLESLRIDLAPDIDVCIASPGFIDTPMTKKNDFDMPMMISAEKAAEHLFYALQKRPMHYRFPKVFALILRTLAFSPLIWFKIIAPKLRKA